VRRPSGTALLILVMVFVIAVLTRIDRVISGQLFCEL
jgi:hypothetical protein